MDMLFSIFVCRSHAALKLCVCTVNKKPLTPPLSGAWETLTPLITTAITTSHLARDFNHYLPSISSSVLFLYYIGRIIAIFIFI